jgi:DNA repair exonuclease SbcCD nuclease subunit
MGKLSKYRALMVADLHMSNRLPFARPGAEDVTDRLRDQINLIAHINEVATAAKVDATFILGDLFDQSRVDAVTLTHTIQALTATEVPMYIMAGNHDANSIRGGRFTVEAFGVMEHERISFLDSELAPRKWLQFIPVPFMPIRETEERINKARKMCAEGATNVLLFHNSVLGCNHLEWTCDDGLDPHDLCEGFDWVIGGHFHTPQRFGPGNQGLYLGAPMHHHFGDRQRTSGFWLVDFHEGGKRDTKYVESETPRFHVTHDMIVNPDWKPGDYVRIEVETTHAEWPKVKPDVKAFCEGLKDAAIRASFKHKPIYHHKKRLKAKSKDAGVKLTLDQAINEYVDASAVVTQGLDKKMLKQIGKEALEAVRSEHGVV